MMRRLRKPMEAVLRSGASSSTSAANRIAPFQVEKCLFGLNQQLSEESGKDHKKVVWKNELERKFHEENQLQFDPVPEVQITAENEVKQVVNILSAILSTGTHGKKIALRVKARYEKYLNLTKKSKTSINTMLRDIEVILTTGAAKAPPGFGWNPNDIMTPLRNVYNDDTLKKEMANAITPDAHENKSSEDVGDGDSFMGFVASDFNLANSTTKQNVLHNHSGEFRAVRNRPRIATIAGKAVPDVRVRFNTPLPEVDYQLEKRQLLLMDLPIGVGSHHIARNLSIFGKVEHVEVHDERTRILRSTNVTTSIADLNNNVKDHASPVYAIVTMSSEAERNAIFSPATRTFGILLRVSEPGSIRQPITRVVYPEVAEAKRTLILTKVHHWGVLQNIAARLGEGGHDVNLNVMNCGALKYNDGPLHSLTAQTTEISAICTQEPAVTESNMELMYIEDNAYSTTFASNIARNNDGVFVLRFNSFTEAYWAQQRLHQSIVFGDVQCQCEFSPKRLSFQSHDEVQAMTGTYGEGDGPSLESFRNNQKEKLEGGRYIDFSMPAKSAVYDKIEDNPFYWCSWSPGDLPGGQIRNYSPAKSSLAS